MHHSPPASLEDLLRRRSAAAITPSLREALEQAWPAVAATTPAPAWPVLAETLDLLSLLSADEPTLLAAIYLFGIAAPQFETEARFLVRGRSSGGGGGAGALAEMAQGSGFKPASEDAMGVRDYLESHDAVAALRQRVPVIEIFCSLPVPLSRRRR